MQNKVLEQKGITFIELMILTVIIGIVAAMAVPRFQIAWERMKSKTESRNITSKLRLARSYAISEKNQYGVYFNRNDLTVILFKDKVNPGSVLFESGDSVVTVDTLPQEFVWVGSDVNNDVVCFRPNGSALFTGGGNFYTIALTPYVTSLGSNNILASTGRVSSNLIVY